MNPQDYQQSVNPHQPEGNTPEGQQYAPPAQQQYAHPGQHHPNQQNQQGNGHQPQLVFVSRPHEPIKPEMSPEVRRRHEDSKAKYPHLNLSEGEFVISAITRHPVGLIRIWAIVGVMLAVLFSVLIAYAAGLFTTMDGAQLFSAPVIAIPVLLLSMLVLLFGFIETSVYHGNRFFLTNESVIQHIQTSLFSKREQTVSLTNIEDASYAQHGILQSILDYGMIRLSTEGDETTYRFEYATNPKRQVATLNNAVEAFKNGRPVTGDQN